MDDIFNQNRIAWNMKVKEKNEWTIPVSQSEVLSAKKGDFRIYLTPTKPVPKHWFPPMKGCDILCLAVGGGQQGPILAAAGGNVTVFDISSGQLEQDRMAAERDGLNINTIEGNMADLSHFPDASFDLIVNPISNCFSPNLIPIWQETYRVLRKSGYMMVGFVNPISYVFDEEKYQKGEFVVRHQLPYSDITSISEEERVQLFGVDDPIEFSHTFESQIGGQLDAGFQMIGFFEDGWKKEKINKYLPSFFATLLVKP